MSQSVFDRVEELLRQHGVSFQVLRHESVYTSQQAADVRGPSLASGAKALVCKGDDQFVMIVLPADLKLDSKTLRRERNWKKLRFAGLEFGLGDWSVCGSSQVAGVGRSCSPLGREQSALRMLAASPDRRAISRQYIRVLQLLPEHPAPLRKPFSPRLLR